jgi:hypothetical protein
VAARQADHGPADGGRQQRQAGGVTDEAGYADQHPADQGDEPVEELRRRSLATVEAGPGLGQHLHAGAADEQRASEAHEQQEDDGGEDPDLAGHGHERRHLGGGEDKEAEEHHSARYRRVGSTPAAPPRGFAPPAAVVSPVMSGRNAEGDGAPPTQAVPGLATAPLTTPEPARRPLRYRVLPRSLLGIASMILAFSLGASLSGAVLFSYYQYRLNATNQKVDTLVEGYKGQFQRAEGDLRATAASAETQLRAALAAGSRSEATPATQQLLVRELAPSLFFVSTQSPSGQSSVGSAFVVASNSSGSLLLTSYTTVRAATTAPGPAVFVRHGNHGSRQRVTVRTWDPSHDLALIVLATPDLPVVKVAPATPAPQIGQPVFAVAGVGAAGASIASGEIDDVSSSGIADDVPLGQAFQGAPIVDSAGRVLAVGSRSYAPLGFSSDAVWYSPFVQSACQRVLSCPGGRLSSST